MAHDSGLIPAAGIPSLARLVASVSSRAPTGSAANRWHSLALWADSGRYWLSVEFQSTWEQEQPRVRGFSLPGSDLSDLVNTLASINPCHDYIHAPALYRLPSKGFPSKAHKIDQAILAAFRAACDQLQRDAAAWFPDSPP